MESTALVPQRPMYYRVPSSLDTITIMCSFCDHESYGDPQFVLPQDRKRLENHKHDEWSMCGFGCKKYLTINGREGHEFWIVDETYFACYECKPKLKGYKLRPYWKIPKSAVLVTKKSDHIRSRTTDSFRKSLSKHEDLWFSYYSRLSDDDRQDDEIAYDYSRYCELKSQNIVE